MSKPPRPPLRRITRSAWLAVAKQIYPTPYEMVFVCVACGHKQSCKQALANGLTEPDRWVYMSCEGRWLDGVGCNWTLGGLLRIHTLEVIDDAHHDQVTPCFDFAHASVLGERKEATCP